MNLQSVKMGLQRMTCPEHYEHPEVTIVGDEIQLKCCCERFKATLVEESKSLLAKAAKDELEKQIKKIFK